MGDVLHTLPALTDAMQALSNICFDWVIEENFAQIAAWHPAVRQVIPVAIRRWRNDWFGLSSRQERYDFKYQLQQHYYDAIIDAQGLMKSAVLVTRIANGEKHGMDFKSAREPFASWFYNKRHNIDKKQHAIERIRQLFATSLGYLLPSSPGDYAIASYFKPQISKVPYLIFLHSTTCSDKHWPESYWRTLIKHAIDVGYHIKLPWQVKCEQLRAQRLARGFRQVEVLPQLKLAQIAEQLVGATAVVSVDTGLSHLAAALDRHNVTLYGPTDPKLIGGYGRNQQALCSKTGMMSGLTAAYVWQTVKVFL